MIMVYPACSARRTHSTVFSRSPSAPQGRRKPSWKTDQVAAASTSSKDRQASSSSRADCWATTGTAGERWNSRSAPGEANPSRSPIPKVRSKPPTGTGAVKGRRRRIRSAFPRCRGPIQTAGSPSTTRSPSKPASFGPTTSRASLDSRRIISSASHSVRCSERG